MQFLQTLLLALITAARLGQRLVITCILVLLRKLDILRLDFDNRLVLLIYFDHIVLIVG